MAWNISLHMCKDPEKTCESINLTQSFTIIDQDDQQRLSRIFAKVKYRCQKNFPNFILALINKWKNSAGIQKC